MQLIALVKMSWIASWVVEFRCRHLHVDQCWQRMTRTSKRRHHATVRQKHKKLTGKFEEMEREREREREPEKEGGRERERRERERERERAREREGRKKRGERGEERREILAYAGGSWVMSKSQDWISASHRPIQTGLLKSLALPSLLNLAWQASEARPWIQISWRSQGVNCAECARLASCVDTCVCEYVYIYVCVCVYI